MSSDSIAHAPDGARPMMGPDRQSISVVICAYTDRRWDALVEALDSVERQTRRPEQTVVVIDHNPALLARARDAFIGATVVANAGARGLSGARNTGVAVARGHIVAFLDDDACARGDWLAELAAGYRDETVVGTGGLVEPRWTNGSPARWLPEEFYWTIGCSYKGLPTGLSAIRNPIGANMSFRRDAIARAGGFREGVGRLDASPLGCEETEMAVRVTNALPGTTILHVPTARIDHLVELDRTRWRYFCARCWAEGLSKAIVARHVGRRAGLASERSYTLLTLPRGVLHGLLDAARGELAGLARAATIVAGLTITVGGYLCGRITRAHGGSLEGRT